MTLYNLDFTFLIPEIFLTISSLFLLVIGTILNEVKKINKLINNKLIIFFSIIILIITLFIFIKLYYNISDYNFYYFNNNFHSTRFIYLVKIIIIFFTIFFFIISLFNLKKKKFFFFEYPILILWATVGLLLLVSSNNFFILFLSLELQSFVLYILVSSNKINSKSSEAGLKFFITGSVASGFLLFGISMIYGVFNSLNFLDLEIINFYWQYTPNKFLIPIILSFSLFIIGILFKLGIVPFHLWLSDIYEGSDTLIISYIAILPKIAVITILSNIIYIFSETTFYISNFSYILVFFSIITIIIGIIGAYSQVKIKRLLAYSSITNMGYILLIISNITYLNIDFLNFIIIIYLIIYSLSIFSLFIILLDLDYFDFNNNNRLVYLHEFSGFYKLNPIISIIILINLFSLIGLPPLSGFFGKFYFILDLIHKDFFFLSLLFLILSVFSVLYYLRIIKIIFFDKLNLRLYFLNSVNLGNLLFLIFNNLIIVSIFIIPDFINIFFFFIINII